MGIAHNIVMCLCFVQPPLAVLLQQLVNVRLASNNRGGCNTPLLTDPLARQRVSAAWLVLEAAPMIWPVIEQPGEALDLSVPFPTCYASMQAEKHWMQVQAVEYCGNIVMNHRHLPRVPPGYPSTRMLMAHP